MSHPQDLDRRFLLGGLTGAAGVAALAHLAKAGPINPPAGPVGSTGRTLDEVYNRIADPANSFDGRTQIAGGVLTAGRVVNIPGAYVLTGNLSIATGQLLNPLSVISSTGPIDIDLNGFTISATVDFSAILLTGPFPVRIRNGFVSVCYYGLSVSSTPLTMEDVVFSRCRISAVNGFSSRVTLRRCSLLDLGAGTLAGDGSIVRGFAIGNGSLAEGCVVHGLSNAGTGALRGFETSVNCTLDHCRVLSATTVTATGFLLGTGTVYRNCTATGVTVGFGGGINAGGNA